MDELPEARGARHEATVEVEVKDGQYHRTHGTLLLKDSDHTIGNAVRCMLMRNRDVEFAGYCMPHPSRREVELRVQTGVGQRDLPGAANAMDVESDDADAPSIIDVTVLAAEQIAAMGEHILETFDQAVETFRAENGR